MHDRPRRDDSGQVFPLVPSSIASPSPSPTASRRRFLFALGATGAGAAAASTAALAAAGSANTLPVDDNTSRGYQETDHVRRYYASARI